MTMQAAVERRCWRDFCSTRGMSHTAIAIEQHFVPERLDAAVSARKIPIPAPEKLPKRALVIDDEPLIRWSVSETLSAAGFTVMQAADAASALRIVTSEQRGVDVIVLDLRLPDMHDLSLFGTLRQLQPRATIVLMTAFGTDEVVERAITMGVGGVLRKPFEMSDVITAVYGGDGSGQGSAR